MRRKKMKHIRITSRCYILAEEIDGFEMFHIGGKVLMLCGLSAD
jgi:hypothetical protein